MANYMVLVDDEQMILNSLSRELRQWARDRDLTIHTATSGEEALEFLKDNYLETVLLMSDQKMPGLKGNELLQTCSREYPQIVLLMLTGYTDINDIVKTIRTGVFSFILKPWDHEDLIYEVTKAYNIYEARRKNNEFLHLIKNETRLAETLFSLLVPIGTEEIGEYRITVNHRSGSDESSGKDFAQYVPLESGKIMLLVGQVSGDRVRAAMLVSVVNALVWGAFLGRVDLDLSNPVVLLNVLAKRVDDITLTMPEIIVKYAVAVLDPTEHTITYALSGLDTWFLLRGNSFAEITGDESGEARVRKISLERGDAVLAPSLGLFPGPDMETSSKAFAKQIIEARAATTATEHEERLLDAVSGVECDRAMLLLEWPE